LADFRATLANFLATPDLTADRRAFFRGLAVDLRLAFFFDGMDEVYHHPNPRVLPRPGCIDRRCLHVQGGKQRADPVPHNLNANAHEEERR